MNLDNWKPIETAPKDGTLLLLLVKHDLLQDNANPTEDVAHGELWPTIGFNQLDLNGEDEWLIAGWCWTHDHFTEGKAQPVYWQYYPQDRPAE